MIPAWWLLWIAAFALAAIFVIPRAVRCRHEHNLMAVAEATREPRPRLGHTGNGPPIEHIPQDYCLDCVDWWDDDGHPIRIHCLIHDQPDPEDDLSLWDAELGQPRVLRLRAWKDQLR